MIQVLKRLKRLICYINFLTVKNQRLTNTLRPYSYFVGYSSQIRLCSAVQNKGFLVSNDGSRLTLSRYKYDSRKKSPAQPQDEESSDEEDEEKDDDDDDDDVFVEKGAEIKTYNVKSLRIDLILKLVLGTSRKKIEEYFYQNKIRVNGKMIKKKSYNAKLDDEIDLIKGHAGDNSNFIMVARVKILKLEPDPDSGFILLKAWRQKSLKIDNYQDKNAWKEHTPEE